MQQRNPQKSPLAGDLLDDDGLGAVARMRYQAQKLGQGVTTQPIGFAGAPGQATPDPQRDANGKIVLGNSPVNRQYTPPPTVTTTAPPAPTNTDPRQAAIDAAKQKSQDKLAAAGGVYDPTGTMDPELKELASSRYALQQQQQVDKVKAEQQAAAAAGISGMGLSGGDLSLQRQVANEADRGDAIALQQFDQNTSNQKWTDVQRQAALDDLETSEDVDLNHDGTVNGKPVGGANGDGNPDNNPPDAADDKGRQKLRDAAQTVDLGLGGDDTPGSEDTPYLTTRKGKSDLEAQGLILTPDPNYAKSRSLYGSTFGAGDRMYVDQDGHHWFIRGGT